MNIEIRSVSDTSATVSWTTDNPCPENYYHIMYRPNWNSVFAGYLSQNFHREERVPHSLSSFVLHRLTPSTVYILCIVCKNAYPSSNHCTTFHTLKQHPLALRSLKQESATSMWMVSSLLLLCFTAFLVYGCLQFWSLRCHRASRLGQESTNPERETGDQTSSPEEMLSTRKKEEMLEVPLTAVLMRSSSVATDSPHGSPRTFFPLQSSRDKRAVLPQHQLK
ncbi:fibronectin type III domain-containing protein 9 [Carettochelys insculpta]|uniref:fibronectin type III domain-containing protein 9 n=1 Tax=Carettochelys insculpta TaxID=44489 RepID=UPI003EB6EE41